MSQTGNPPGAMVDSAMPAGGGAEDVLIEAEAQSPGITEEILEELIVEAGEGDTLDPEEALQEIGHTSNLAESLDERVLEGPEVYPGRSILER